MRPAGRIAVVAMFVAIAAVLFVVLRDDGEDGAGTTTSEPASSEQATTPPPPPPEPMPELVVMRDGAPVGGVSEFTYTTGDRVLIKVKLDEPQEDVHIHGYEIEKLNPSGSVTFDFKAVLDGIFELEAHGPSGDVPLAEIRVEPS